MRHEMQRHNPRWVANDQALVAWLSHFNRATREKQRVESVYDDDGKMQPLSKACCTLIVSYLLTFTLK